ncbi:MAG: hypothetical protein FJ388_24220, partial [Verrucomicrobia bacterium]|nr:hypothetical protein [Verrucomicrobiota bacterium]
MRRRDLLTLPAVTLGSAAAGRKPRIAAILTIFAPNSHGDVFMMRLIQGYRLNKKTCHPRLD